MAIIKYFMCHFFIDSVKKNVNLLGEKRERTGIIDIRIYDFRAQVDR